MQLDNSFEEEINKEFFRKYAANELPKEFTFLLDQYQKEQDITTLSAVNKSTKKQYVQKKLKLIFDQFDRPFDRPRVHTLGRNNKRALPS